MFVFHYESVITGYRVANKVDKSLLTLWSTPIVITLTFHLFRKLSLGLLSAIVLNSYLPKSKGTFYVCKYTPVCCQKIDLSCHPSHPRQQKMLMDSIITYILVLGQMNSWGMHLCYLLWVRKFGGENNSFHDKSLAVWTNQFPAHLWHPFKNTYAYRFSNLIMVVCRFYICQSHAMWPK